MDKNLVHLIGEIARNPVFKRGNSGNPYLLLGVKTETEASQYPSYTDAIAFGDNAENNQGLKQGDRVELVGSVRTTKHRQTGDYETKVFVDELKASAPKPKQDNQSDPGDDIPF
jgi:single-stranded DNA-binding protein